MSMSSAKTFEDVKVGVRLKIAALWIAMLFLFAYGDIFGFFAPGRLGEIMTGKVSGIEITQLFLFAISVYAAVASLMIFSTLVLRPNICRWANIVVPVLYIVSIVASAIGETDAYYLFLSVVEIALLVLAIRFAWTWPTQEAGGAQS